MLPDVARLTGHVRETRQMTASLFFRAIQGDLSPDDRPQTVIYLLRALKWENEGAVVMEIDKRQGESQRREKLDRPFVLLQYQQPFGTSQ